MIASDYLAGLLQDLLRARMVNLTTETEKDLFEQSSGPLKTLSGRIKLAYALGWIGAGMLADLDLIRKMRNDFAAHSHQSTRFTDRSLKQKCASFKGLRFLSGRALTPRTQFFFAVIALALQLNYLHATSRHPPTGFDPDIEQVVNPDGLE